MFLFDPLYFVFALPALLLAFYAQYKVRTAYSRYLAVPNGARASGVEVARRLLAAHGLGAVAVEGTPGELTDHYDPRSKVLRLSQGVARSPSVAAMAIVAHEVGHAQQDSDGYALLRLRGALVPAVNVGSWLGPILFVVGIVLRATSLSWLGVWLFAAAAVFTLITLPVELDASRRALSMLRGSYVIDVAETGGVRAVLSAAALTYVAALAQALSNLLYYVFLLSGMRRND